MQLQSIECDGKVLNKFAKMWVHLFKLRNNYVNNYSYKL